MNKNELTNIIFEIVGLINKPYSEKKIIDYTDKFFISAIKNQLLFNKDIIKLVFATNDVEKTISSLDSFQNIIEYNSSDLKALSVLFNLISCSNFAEGFILKNQWVLQAICQISLSAPIKFIIRNSNENLEAFMRNLRITKNVYYLAIAYHEAIGMIDTEETLYRYSELADFLITSAFQYVCTYLEKTYGEPTFGEPIFTDNSDNKNKSEFVIIGLGKLGGMELNYSSDVDIMYLYSSDQRDAGPSLTINEYYSKYSRMITKILGEITDDGFALRVDLNLRPLGLKGEIANSVRSAELYYNYWGSTWERAMLLKARFIAGSQSLYSEFISSVRNFVIKKHLDFETVEDFREMKNEIDNNLEDSDSNDWNVKMGRGGIREVEFFVQTLILANSGRVNDIISNNTKMAIIKLQEYKLISEEESKLLISSYFFLRKLENAIQFEDNLPKHTLAAEDFEKMALKLGYYPLHPEKARETFILDMNSSRQIVVNLYNRLFYEPEEKISVTGEKFDIFREVQNESQLELKLEEMGFNEPQKIKIVLLDIARISSIGRMPMKVKRNIRKVVDFTLNAMLKLPEREKTLTHFAEFLQKNKLKAALLALLAHHPETLKFLINLFGTTPFLSEFLILHPELIDSIVMSSEFRSRKYKSDYDSEIKKRLKENPTINEKIEIIRSFKNEEILRIAINDVNKKISISSVQSQLSDLADILLKYVVQIAGELLNKKYGKRDIKIAILALGKLGAREILYTSDLDLIFIYEESNSTSNGISDQEYYTKLAQKIIMILSIPTENGILYQIDMRLRPSGNQGVLVVSRESFIDYYAKKSEIWEKQTLLRARFVYGKNELKRSLTNAFIRSIFKDIDINEIQIKMSQMREKMLSSISDGERDGKHIDVKRERGGIVDVEFIVQLLKFKYGSSHPELLNPNTALTIRRCGELKIWNRDETRRLIHSYIFLRRVENGIKLFTSRNISDFEHSKRDYYMLGSYLGFDGTEEEIIKAFNLHFEKNINEVNYFYKKFFAN